MENNKSNTKKDHGPKIGNPLLKRKLTSGEIYSLIAEDGLEEMSRPSSALAFSGIAAGLAIGFSVVAEAVLLARLPPEMAGRSLIADIGYSVGFVLVILGNLQLFTENTISPVLPTLKKATDKALSRLLRVWGLVFSANIIGCILFAAFITQSGALKPDMVDAVLSISRHATEGGFWETVAGGIGAGFLIAALVWMLAGSSGSGLALTMVVTYVIALAEFSHVIAGTVEVSALVFAGQIGILEGVGGFMVPALIGNILGGTCLFSLLAYAQVRQEVK